MNNIVEGESRNVFKAGRRPLAGKANGEKKLDKKKGYGIILIVVIVLAVIANK